MMEIWQEHSNFQTTSQRLTDQVRIIKKGWFSDLEILEIHQKINDHQGSIDTLPGTSNINKHNPSEMNHQFWKMETPTNQTLHNETTHNRHYHKNKS